MILATELELYSKLCDFDSKIVTRHQITQSSTSHIGFGVSDQQVEPIRFHNSVSCYLIARVFSLYIFNEVYFMKFSHAFSGAYKYQVNAIKEPCFHACVTGKWQTKGAYEFSAVGFRLFNLYGCIQLQRRQCRVVELEVTKLSHLTMIF